MSGSSRKILTTLRYDFPAIIDEKEWIEFGSELEKKPSPAVDFFRKSYEEKDFEGVTLWDILKLAINEPPQLRQFCDDQHIENFKTPVTRNSHCLMNAVKAYVKRIPNNNLEKLYQEDLEAEMIGLAAGKIKMSNGKITDEAIKAMIEKSLNQKVAGFSKHEEKESDSSTIITETELKKIEARCKNKIVEKLTDHLITLINHAVGTNQSRENFIRNNPHYKALLEQKPTAVINPNFSLESTLDEILAVESGVSTEKRKTASAEQSVRFGGKR